MAAELIGIVYAARSGIVRRIIVPDDDGELARRGPGSHVGAGEDIVTVPRDQVRRDRAGFPNLGDVRAVLEKALGRPSPSARCALIDKAGNVVGTLMADPELDQVAGCTLALNEVAEVGWALVGDVLTAPVIGVGPIGIDPIGVDPIVAVDPAAGT